MAFFKILNMSLTASIVILAVLAARLLLRRAPRVFSYALWAIVLFRLVCPVSLSSAFSLFRVVNTPVTQSGYVEYVPASVEAAVTVPAGEVSPAAESGKTAGPLFTVLWLTGVGAMLLYSLAAFLRLKRRLVGALRLSRGVYLADHISSPFVTGIFRPRIYLPSGLSASEQEYVLTHERQHIRRGDHIIKALSFFALCLHWFNPLVWLAFTLSGEDMETSCDEAVLRRSATDIRADYSACLLSLSTGRRVISGTPLAFGEGDTRRRVKNALSYKKPAFWLCIAASVVIIALAVCLVTNPFAKNEPYSEIDYSVFDGDGTYTAGALLGQDPRLSYLPPDGSHYAEITLSHYSLKVTSENGETLYSDGGSTVRQMTRKALLKELEDAAIAVEVPEYDDISDMAIYSYYPSDGSADDIVYSIYWFNGKPTWFAEGIMLRIYELEPK